MLKHIGNIEKLKIELMNNKNNAVAFIYEGINSQKGPLANSAFTIKNAYATKKTETNASSKILKGFIPGYDATIVKLLKSNGATLVGKTNMDELALGGTGMFSIAGPILNPLNNARIVGGSSSGAAATFTKHVAIAIGSDTGDSVRLPASYNGLVGFKPSYGAVSRYGLFPFASSFDTVAWFSHNVHDSIETAKVLFGKDDNDMTTKNIPLINITLNKPKVVGFLHSNFYTKIQRSKIESLKKILKSEGIEIKNLTINNELLDMTEIVYDIISYAEASSNNANLNGVAFGKREFDNHWEQIMINSRSEGFGPMVQRRFALGAYFLKEKNQIELFQKAKKIRRIIKQEFNKIQNMVDVVVFPSSTIAPKIVDGKASNSYTNILANANIGGFPSITMPFGIENSMPFGLSLEVPLYQDEKLLSIALYFEKILKEKYE